MFGRQDNQVSQTTDQTMNDQVAALSSTSTDSPSPNAYSGATFGTTSTNDNTTQSDTPNDTSSSPVEEITSTNDPTSVTSSISTDNITASAPVSEDSSSTDTGESSSLPMETPASSMAGDVNPIEPTSTSDPTSDSLIDIKQQALQQLSPLVGHLDQTPEEKFRTTMMMIQASDNQALISSAYEAAQSITDEKVKAQALLDIVNEINYFTQHSTAE